ncbi:MAG: hypothetical protein KIT22_01585 [Verrucomicrobiae bacterium]|nr:hypothetical protein [Verrucomicrobiae bacterium]
MILVPVLISALNALQLDAVTKPASDMLGKILAALPNLLGAAVVVLLAVVIGKKSSPASFQSADGTRPGNALPLKLGLAKAPPQAGRQTPAAFVGLLLRTLILLLASITAADMLEFPGVGV